MLTPALLIALIESIPKMVNLAERFANWMGGRDLNAWVNQLEGAVDDLEKADTTEQRLAAARKLLDSIRHI